MCYSQCDINLSIGQTWWQIAASQLQGSGFNPELVFMWISSKFPSFIPLSKQHVSRQIGYAKFPPGVNACVDGALSWTGVPSGVEFSHHTPRINSCDLDQDKLVSEDE